jgi:putative endonuclease
MAERRVQDGRVRGAAAGDRRLRFGRAAEEAAAKYLTRTGWRVLARNQRVGRGELDIIARRGVVLAFVEVKARRSRTCGSPEDAVTPRKQAQIRRLAELWLGSRPWALRGVDDVRFDVVAVDAACDPPRLRHLPGAFGVL